MGAELCEEVQQVVTAPQVTAAAVVNNQPPVFGSVSLGTPNARTGNGVELPANSFLDGLGNAVYRAMYGSAWIAEAGVHYDMNSGLYPTTGWANASHLPYLPMILRPDDLARGSIDHMLGIVISKDRGTGYTWPAGGGDGNGTNGVPMGSVLRLRADFDMSGYSASTQDGAKLLAMSNGWAGTEYLTAQAELNKVPMSAFEVVDVSGIRVDPATGWQISQ